jgi:hypothetical protein
MLLCDHFMEQQRYNNGTLPSHVLSTLSQGTESPPASFLALNAPFLIAEKAAVTSNVGASQY